VSRGSGLDGVAGQAPAAPARVVETHVSTVFLVGERAYKLKKPVVADFVDLSTLAARRAACEAEVELNRRLAPDVYEGVATVCGPGGEPWDHLVVMRRLPDDRRLTRVVERSRSAGEQAVVAVAQVVASFHRRAEHSERIDEAGAPGFVLALWSSSLRTLEGSELPAGARELAARIGSLARRYVLGCAPAFEVRVRSGRIVDGHGDLQADDVFCLDDGPRLLDCLEFDAELRHGDVLADVAFLAMDLERLGHAKLAECFLRAYASASGDAWPASLREHWVAYRALVRAKVAALRAAQGDVSASARAAKLLALCWAHLEAAIPRLVLVGGLPGTGKSTLAAGIAAARGWQLLRSDVVRRDLANDQQASPGAPGFGTGRYRPGEVARTYAAMLARAVELVRGGESVVLDATWTSRRQRQLAALAAASCGAHLVALRCDAPLALAARRIARRAAAGLDASEASARVAREMAARADAWPEAATVDTTGAKRTSLGAALKAIAASRPTG